MLQINNADINIKKWKKIFLYRFKQFKTVGDQPHK